jgi:hypothetical protein
LISKFKVNTDGSSVLLNAMSLKNKTALVWDQGSFLPFAQALGGEGGFGRVFYYSPRTSFMSKSQDALVGRDIEPLERVDSFWSYVNEADTIVFPDCGDGDLQHWLREKGYSVWGSARAEMLELDRWNFRKLLEELKQPVPDTVRVIGIKALREEIKNREDCYIKTSFFRGDLETRHFTSYDIDKPWIDELELHLGPHAVEIELIIEDPICGIEPGYDGFCIDGKFPKTAMFGYEAKDSSYLGKVIAFDDMPDALRDTASILSMPLKQLGQRGNFHTEVRIEEETGEVYLLDPCQRCGSPPIETMVCMIDNWGEIVEAGARGEIVEPDFAAKYGAQIILKSNWVLENFLSIKTDPAFEPFLKLRRAVRYGEQLWSIPSSELELIGSAVGVGDTSEAAIDMALEVAESVEALEIEYAKDAKEKLLELAKEGEGILGQKF